MERPKRNAAAFDPAMPERIPEPLQKKIADRLSFYEDIGIRQFYRNRRAELASGSDQRFDIPNNSTHSILIPREEPPLPNPARKPELPKPVSLTAPTPSKISLPPLPVVAGPSLFESIDKIANDTLLKVREDLGECTRCKLHSTRHKIVFGDGNPKAELVFVGEGPGADEDAQGLPFVGRAGKLLTQMIEAMGLQRKDVYICNVVKCRPPENRQPEEDEVSTCSPFLLRQIDTIAPKVIVCLGAVAAKTLLQTNRGISQFRGEWLEFRGRKLLATYHPAYLLRNPPAKSEVWKDLQKVMAVLGLEVKKGKSA
jgi:uracil-DNA glycosylase family 4